MDIALGFIILGTCLMIIVRNQLNPMLERLESIENRLKDIEEDMKFKKNILD
tara:strand:- start:214 stop:369 length:156 start_codon:yes stop_codon:yes gene_type:complete